MQKCPGSNGWIQHVVLTGFWHVHYRK